MGMTVFVSLSFLAVAALSFYAGKTTADRYHNDREREIKDALHRQYLRLQSGSDADDPVQPYAAKQVIDGQFMTHLRQNGRATKQVS